MTFRHMWQNWGTLDVDVLPTLQFHRVVNHAATSLVLNSLLWRYDVVLSLSLSQVDRN